MKPRTNRLIYRDGEYFSFCSHCNEYLDVKHFSPTNREHGYTYVCKICLRKEQTEKKTRPENPKDLQLAHEMLKNIGYNPDSKFSIHNQFLKKHFS
jgi:hypothetical protein